MSSTDKKSSPCHGFSHDSTPRYVKKLNFGQRLETNLKSHQQQPRQSSFEIVFENQEQDLLILNKESYVKEWLKKHEDKFFEENNLVYPSSPVLSSSISSATKRTPGSPILGSSTKRPRRLNSQNNSRRKDSLNLLDVDRLKSKNGSLSSSILSCQTQQSSSRVQEKSSQKSQDENLRQPLFLPTSPSSSYVTKSPVLSGTVRSRRFRKRRVSECKSKTKSVKLEDSLNLKNSANLEKILKIEDDTIPSVSMTGSILEKKSDSSKIDDETFFEKGENTEPMIKEEEIEEEVEEEDLFQSQKTFDPVIENESSIKENLLIETKEYKAIRDNESTFIDDKTETEETASDFIEDFDTEVIILPDVKNEPMSVEEKFPMPSQSLSKDSDETFFSKAESCSRSQIIQPSQILPTSQVFQPSQIISQVSSSKIKAESLSQINISVSAETSSQKPIEEPFISMLKTEKRKRKVKKGSLVAKLKTLISREISFMRIWQHQTSQPTFQNNNVQFIHLCIEKSYKAYSRQFTECHLISDTFNLLKKISSPQTQQDADSEHVNRQRTITIMTVPDIVGVLNAEKGKCMKVYHPWEILDQANLTLSVTYFTIDEKVNSESENEQIIEAVKSKTIETFDCPCIREGKVFEDCSSKFDCRKPKVIKDIFNTS